MVLVRGGPYNFSSPRPVLHDVNLGFGLAPLSEEIELVGGDADVDPTGDKNARDEIPTQSA